MSPRDTTQLQVPFGEGWLSALLCPHLQELHLEAESLVVSVPLLPSFLLPSALTTSSPSSIAGLTWHKSISVVRETVTTCNVCIAFLLIRSCWSGSAKAIWNSPLTLPFLEQGWDPARLGLGLKPRSKNTAPSLSAIFLFLSRSLMLPAGLEVSSWLGFAAQIRAQKGENSVQRKPGQCLFLRHIRSWLHTPPKEAFLLGSGNVSNWLSLTILSKDRKPSSC